MEKKNSLPIKCLAFSLMNKSMLPDLTSFLRIRRLGMIGCIASLLCLHAISLISVFIFIFLHSMCPCVLEHVHGYMGAYVNIGVHLRMEGSEVIAGVFPRVIPIRL